MGQRKFPKIPYICQQCQAKCCQALMTSASLPQVIVNLANPYKVLNNMVSEFITAITNLSETLYILSALSTLFGRYVR